MSDGRADAVELTVRDAGSRDAGRGIVRLPESARRALGVLSGDSVVVEGRRPVVAKAWPTNSRIPDDCIQLDEQTRANIGVDVGDAVRIHTGSLEDASTVVVDPVTSLPDGEIESTLQRILRDRPVTTGDRIDLDGEDLDATFIVRQVRPSGTVRIIDETTIQIGTSEPSPRSDRDASRQPVDEAPATRAFDAGQTATTYDDIGGLDKELELVREMIELPLDEPDLFRQVGIEPPKGVLLYGPPGTGKTLIAEAVATAANATFYHISGPEIMSKYKGESEERLREIFERARDTAPAIVFFDEIDALASTREDADAESRIVAQLLSLLDGLETRGQVIVIGATNRVDAIDPALRRPGRFDREIEIGVPDEPGRREILAVHTTGVPLADDVDLDRLAARTYGFVGADLRALVTEAAMLALRRTHEDAGTIELTRDDFETALAGIEPSAMREFVAETPTTSFDDVGGLEAAKTTLREAIEWPLAYPRLFEATRTEAPSGILLYGPPGTGKTLLARAIAHESGVNFIRVAGPELIDKYVGESEKAIREVFERARQAAPTIVFFDEIDAIASRRGDDHEVTARVVSQLLTELDGLADNPSLLVIAATNRKEVLDPALLRPGRLETLVEVGLPDHEARREILAVHTREKPLADGVDLDALAANLDGATGADIEAIVREASMRAIRDAISDLGIEEANAQASAIEIRADHFETAIEQRLSQRDG